MENMFFPHSLLPPHMLATTLYNIKSTGNEGLLLICLQGPCAISNPLGKKASSSYACKDPVQYQIYCERRPPPHMLARTLCNIKSTWKEGQDRNMPFWDAQFTYYTHCPFLYMSVKHLFPCCEVNVSDHVLLKSISSFLCSPLIPRH